MAFIVFRSIPSSCHRDQISSRRPGLVKLSLMIA